MFYFGVWLSLVERYVRDVEVASSNLVTPTSFLLSAESALRLPSAVWKRSFFQARKTVRTSKDLGKASKPLKSAALLQVFSGGIQF